jgi:hypothetical protein
VGKGQGDRVFQHLKEVEPYIDLMPKFINAKQNRIKEILDDGFELRHVILREGLSESESLEVEAAMIDLLGIENLTNQVRGVGTERGKRDAERLNYPSYRTKKYDFEFLCQDNCIIEKPTILFRMNQLFSEEFTSVDLYEAARGIWRVNSKRAESAVYGMVVSKSLVREVYEIEPGSWTQFDPGHRNIQLPSRKDQDIYQDAKYSNGYWLFAGKVADPLTRDKYLMKSVSGYFTPGSSNIIQYVGC